MSRREVQWTWLCGGEILIPATGCGRTTSVDAVEAIKVTFEASLGSMSETLEDDLRDVFKLLYDEDEWNLDDGVSLATHCYLRITD